MVIDIFAAPFPSTPDTKLDNLVYRLMLLFIFYLTEMKKKNFSQNTTFVFQPISKKCKCGSYGSDKMLPRDAPMGRLLTY